MSKGGRWGAHLVELEDPLLNWDWSWVLDAANHWASCLTFTPSCWLAIPTLLLSVFSSLFPPSQPPPSLNPFALLCHELPLCHPFVTGYFWVPALTEVNTYDSVEESSWKGASQTHLGDLRSSDLHSLWQHLSHYPHPHKINVLQILQVSFRSPELSLQAFSPSFLPHSHICGHQINECWSEDENVGGAYFRASRSPSQYLGFHSSPLQNEHYVLLMSNG